MGTELLATGSLLSAFLAGGVALFAPCCIVFLAPSYLAGAAKSRRWRLFPLTLVFAGGLALVLVPLTMGASLLAGAIAKYHAPVYVMGGLLMFGMAYLTLSGKMWSLPNFLRMPDTRRGDSASFFALGVFSGIASSCCAPVLAGVMTLSALSGSVGGGLVLGLAYVFGMAFPLFIMAVVWDRAGMSRRSFVQARPVVLRLGRFTRTVDLVNLLVAIGFVAMGIAIMALATSTTMTGGSAIQDWISDRLTEFFAQIQAWLSPVPQPLLALIVVAVAASIFVAAFTGRHDKRAKEPETQASERTMS